MRPILAFALLLTIGCGDGADDVDMATDVDLASSTDSATISIDLSDPDGGGGNVDVGGGADLTMLSCAMTPCTPGAMADAMCQTACGTATATCVGIGGGMHRCMP